MVKRPAERQGKGGEPLVLPGAAIFQSFPELPGDLLVLMKDFQNRLE